MSASPKSLHLIFILVVFAVGYALGSLDGGAGKGLEFIPTAQAVPEYSDIPCPRVAFQFCKRNETLGYDFVSIQYARTVRSVNFAGGRVTAIFH